MTAADRNTERRNVLIGLADGADLAADLYLPDETGTHPTLVSYYPYHKDDIIGAAYEHANRWFCRHGYATVLVDFRGLGGSSGQAAPAMDPGEGPDGAAIVEWAAAQDWSDGRIGMWGLSYGGITSLATAAQRPPSLRSIVPIMGTHDIYHHWFNPGGCPNMLGVYGVWGPMMLALQLMPPMFHDEAGRWRQVWGQRLEEARPYVLDWPDHPDFDDYWQQRVIALEEIDVPALFIGGWRDIFPEAMVQAFGRVGGHAELLMGPWLHTQPNQSPFDPIEHLPTMLDFWDRTLRGRDRRSVGPVERVTFQVQGGGWFAADTWPPDPGNHLILHATGDGRLAAEPDPTRSERQHRVDPTAGTASTLFDPLGQGIGLPLDQSADDARSLSFTSDAIDEPVVLAGSPRVAVDLAFEEADELHLVVKLCDVTDGGGSELITSGWLSVDGPGRHEVGMWATGYLLEPGHRLRLSISGADFPRIWPTADNPTVIVTTGPECTSLTLPVTGRERLRSVTPPLPEPGIDRAPLNRDFEPRWRVVRDLANGTVATETGIRSVLVTPSLDGRVELDHLATATVDPVRPSDARVVARTEVVLDTPSGARVEIRSRSSASRRSLSLSGQVTVDGVPHFERHWRRDP